MKDKVLRYIREQALMRAGDRVGLAVSGGADSVALLRVLLELRNELGIVLAVVHFNHKIRGAEADADEEFVCRLAQKYQLQFLPASGDVPGYSQARALSLEAAGREMRYDYFRSLLAQAVDVLATAHTADDQAETVLMRLIRGAGSKGLAGIHPRRFEAQSSKFGAQQRPREGEIRHAIVRPMLPVRRREVGEYLGALKQEWREDATNRDLRQLRNRVRHVLVPLLEREFNPAIVQVLADMAEMARGEEEFWQQQVKEASPETMLDGIEASKVSKLPVALQRRLIRAAAEQAGAWLDFQHVEQMRKLLSARAGCRTELPHGWRAQRDEKAIRLQRIEVPGTTDYQYRLPIPGEVRVPEVGSMVKAFFVQGSMAASGYNPATAWDPRKLASELVIRNWRAGDRFWPAHTKSEKKLKELLQEHRVPHAKRSGWPVAESRGTIVWVRGFPPASRFLARPECEQVVAIEEIAIKDNP